MGKLKNYNSVARFIHFQTPNQELNSKMPENTNQSHVITIDEEVVLMNAQMKESPKLLRKSAGNSSCCIFRVPQSLAEINKEAYRPQIVSIGPYHHGKKDLEMIQEHKWRYLDDMITRTGKSLGVFMNIIVSMENKIRESYSESTDCFGTNDLAKMMVGKSMAFDVKTNYLGHLFWGLNVYTRYGWNVAWAQFMYTYFEHPWALISLIVGIIGLNLTAIQAFYAVYSHKNN
ncbi:hypothetical protein HanRHA438_Chr02g0091961 [Helianthus annuus]|nr:hypothetical protein HanRHA438_Chr02g0091961 [Helianthus annuus]